MPNHSPHKTRSSRARQLALFAACWFGLLAAGLHVGSTQAQDDPPPGTVPPPFFLPIVTVGEVGPPPGVYEVIPIEGNPTDRPAAQHADLNLALRGYTTTTAALALIDLGGDTDPDAPQLDGIFDPPQLPGVVAAYRVYDWDWGCGPAGCRGAPLDTWAVTLLEVTATRGISLFIPLRQPEIHAGGYRALVLYAEATRLTLGYTRRDTAAVGYVVHLEDIQVDAGLVARYEEMNNAGRQQLPALRNRERLGYASGASFKVAIRDTGSFMDPRSRKDWWMGHLMVNAKW